MQWSYRVGNQVFGPLEFDQLVQLAALRQLPPQALIRYGNQEWVPATSMPQLAMIFQQQPPPPVVPPQPPRAKAVPAPVAMPTPVPVARVAVPVAVPVPPQGIPTGQPVAYGYPPAPPPLGVPVGQPVAPPVGVPMGQAVGYPPPPPVAGAAIPMVQVAVGTAGSSKPTAATPASKAGPQKKDSGKLLLMGLGGCIAACAIIGLLVVFNSGAKPKEIVAEKEPNLEVDDSIGETPEDAEAKPASKPAIKTTATASLPPSQPQAESPEKKLVKSVARWNDASTGRIIKFSKVARIELVSMWLASDAAGTRVKKNAPPAAATSEAKPAVDNENPTGETPASEAPADETPTESTPPAEPAATPSVAPSKPKYVFIELQVTNDSDQPLKYRSWNGVAAETAAILAFAEAELLPAVPQSATPAAQRLDRAVDIPPKQSVRDVVVFAAPEESFEQLRLLLPRAAIAGLGTGHTAWQIPQDLLYLEPAPTANLTAGNRTAGGTSTAPPSSIPVTAERKEFESLLKDIGKVNAPDRPGRPVTEKTTEKPGEEQPADGKPEMKKEPPADEEMKKEEPKKPEPPSIKDLEKQIKDLNDGKPKTEPEKPTTDEKPAEK